MLYTVLPIEHVLGQPSWQRGIFEPWRVPATYPMGSAESVEAPMPVACNVGGVPLLVWPMPDGRGQVERVMSTDPADYLNPSIAPGSMVDMPAVCP